MYFTLAFETGARTGELLALTWADYDGEALSISKAIVRGEETDTKTHQNRRVLLTRRAIDALRDHTTRFKDSFIFLHKGAHFTSAYELNKEWKAALGEANIPYRRAYTCRHTYASLGLTAGAKPVCMAKQLGHSLNIFFDTYAKYMESQDDQRELREMERIQKLGKVGDGLPFPLSNVSTI